MNFVAASRFTGMDVPSTVLLPAAVVAQPAPLAGIVLFDEASTLRPLRHFRPLHGRVDEVKAWHIAEALLSDEYIVHRGDVIYADCSFHCTHARRVEPVRAALAARLGSLPLTVDETYAQESALVFHSEGGGTWGHFLIQFLPKALAFLQRFPQGKLAVPVRLVQHGNAFHAAFAAYGIGDDRVLPVAHGCTYKFRELVIADVPYNFQARLPHPRMLAKLAALGLPTDAEDGGRPLFVSRSDTRTIANQPAVDAVLDRFGIERIALGATPFAEQVQKWRGASAVIATLGSDLTNLIFAAPGTPLLVLSPDWFGDDFFFNLALLQGLRWNELRCGRVGEKREPERMSGFHVDTEHFETLLRSILPPGAGTCGMVRFHPVTREERLAIFEEVIKSPKGQSLPRRLLVADATASGQAAGAALAPLGFTMIGAEELAGETMVPLFAGAQAVVLLDRLGLREVRYCAPGTLVFAVDELQDGEAGAYLASLGLRHLPVGAPIDDDGINAMVGAVQVLLDPGPIMPRRGGSDQP
jgi:hypothetical protein